MAITPRLLMINKLLAGSCLIMRPPTSKLSPSTPPSAPPALMLVFVVVVVVANCLVADLVDLFLAPVVSSCDCPVLFIDGSRQKKTGARKSCREMGEGMGWQGENAKCE